MVCLERILAMKFGFAIPIVGSAVSSAAGLSAFCRGLEDLGYGTLWVGDRLVTPVDMHSTYPGKEQPYPPQMTRYLDPVLLWTVAATATSRVRLNASTLSTFYYEPPHLARVNVLTPGQVATPIQEQLFDEETKAQFEALIPRGKMGNPEEIATVALFLASDDSSYVNGMELIVDGGTTAV